MMSFKFRLFFLLNTVISIKDRLVRVTAFKFVTLLIIAVLGLLQPLAAQEYKPFIDSVPFDTGDDGIRHQIMSDKQGMLWLSTTNGLLYRYNSSIGSSSIRTDIYGDSQIDDWGRVWISQLLEPTLFAGYLDNTNGSYVPVRLLEPNGQTIKFENTIGLQFSTSSIWLLTKNGELLQATLTKQQTTQIKFEHKTQLTIHDVAFVGRINLFTPSALTIDALNNIWIALGDQLLRYQPKSNHIDDFSHILPTGITIDFGIDVAITDKQITWLNMYGVNTLFKIDQANQVTGIDIPYRLQDIKFDSSRNRIWIASTNGLYYLKGDDIQIHN